MSTKSDSISQPVLPLESWSSASSHAHSDDILCVAFGSPHLMATASYDGEVSILVSILVGILVSILVSILTSMWAEFWARAYCGYFNWLKKSKNLKK